MPKYQTHLGREGFRSALGLRAREFVARGAAAEEIAEHHSTGDLWEFTSRRAAASYTDEALDLYWAHVGQAQNAFGRRLLIENPTTYLRFRHSTMDEVEFLNLS